MRVIIFGVGAIGGTVAAALAHSGQEVVGIARGAQLQAIRTRGLTLRAPGRTIEARFDCVAAPSDLAFRPDDAVLLTMKTQDTLPALQALRAAGLRDQPVFCLQNGVANERMAQRLFANVFGVTVMLPAGFVEPGEVAIFAEPRFGMFDIGRYSPGAMDAAEALAPILEAANIAAFLVPDVMASKYGKLLVNLQNVVQAALGRGTDDGGLVARLRAEAETAYRAAGIVWDDVGMENPRRKEFLRPSPVPGVERVGGSTVQSLLRGTGSVETDYLNGEIALLGRMHGVPVPLNAAMTTLGAKLAQNAVPPASMTLADLDRFVLDHTA